MGDILSQDEIDALLRAMASGGGGVEEDAALAKKAGKKVINYDFSRPSKFNKEQLRTLEILFDNYARLTSSFLTGYLRTVVTIEVLNAEQLTYNDFAASIANPAILGIVDFQPFKGSILLDMTAEIGYAIIDRILGGPGFSLKKTRDFTEIETILMERILTQMMNGMIEPWAPITPLQPKVSRIETNAQFAQIIAPSEMIALVTLSIKVGGVEGYLNFCFPHFVIEPIVSKLNTRYRFAYLDDEDNSEYQAKLEENLEKTFVPVSVAVGRTSITVSDFVNLQVGDVLLLDSYYTSDMDVMVGDLLKFKAKPGLSKHKNAIQITSVIREAD
ncbi:MAG: flagellar motor switch protein FliM [Clostridiales bacterium]|jgi:flagellar motor switch protein FliM|nr:flagellar motor switch protein FliM [Clostridiales bacterium]